MQIAHSIEHGYQRRMTERAQIVAWLQQVLHKTGETPSALARRAGLATTTLTRFLNAHDAPLLTTRTLAKIAHAAKVAPMIEGTTPDVAPQRHLSECDGTPYLVGATALTALIAGRTAADPWVLRSTLLTGIGYLPGDIMIVDLNARPEAGDVVCAQVYTWRDGTAETVFRLYDPPYLLAAPLDPIVLQQTPRKLLLVDNDRVLIKASVTDLLRRRHALDQHLK